MGVMAEDGRKQAAEGIERLRDTLEAVAMQILADVPAVRRARLLAAIVDARSVTSAWVDNFNESDVSQAMQLVASGADETDVQGQFEFLRRSDLTDTPRKVWKFVLLVLEGSSSAPEGA
jgi:hypothetical protein